MKKNITNSEVYVCNKKSYGQGKNLELINYPDFISFREECSGLFTKNEEYIYFDYENIPDIYISERWISPNYFALIKAVTHLDVNDQEAFSVWLDCNKPDLEENGAMDIINKFRFCYEGNYKNPLLFACKYAREQLNITKQNNPSFDFNGYEKMIFRDFFLFVEGGYVFKKIPKY